MPAGEHGRTPRFLGGWRDVRASLAIGLCCFAVYNANGRSIGAGDTYPTRYLPFAILRHHTLALDPIARLVAQGQGRDAFWMRNAPTGHTVSLYPVVQPVLIAPLYVPAIAYLNQRDWQGWRVDHVARVMEKLVASLVAALSASILYLVLRRRAAPSVATLLAVAYAFGTTTWMISSQALWQHGMAQLLIVGLLLFLTAPCTVPRAIAAGLLCGLIAGNRPPDAILAAALGAFGLFWAGRRWAGFVLASVLPAALVMLYNLRVAGHFAGAYGLAGDQRFFDYSALAGLAGLLVSPTRGLFVFSPFLLFLVLAWRHPPAEGQADVGLTWAMGLGIAAQLLLYSRTDWRAGVSWGPRYLTDALPLLVWLLAPVVTALRGAGRALFIGAVGVAVVIEAIGAWCYTGRSDRALYALGKGPDGLRAAWDWRRAPFIASWREGRAPAALMTSIHGNFDAAVVGDRPTSAIAPGDQVVLTGWALAGHATPHQVAVEIPGAEAVTTDRFTDRADVRATLGETSPSGWAIPLPTAGLTAGDHVLEAYVWATENGERHFLAERTLTVRGPAPGLFAAGDELGPAFDVAAARVRGHQQPDGSWLTTHTTTTRFADPQPEMNTYLTSLLVDLLDPVAKAGGLSGSVARARTHLTAQVEAGGLVRYHGLPDGPGIGTLGCVITPDSDDTSLVWRIAPPRDRTRLTRALATLERYRTRDGLYRTWLAPRDAYQCLDPGADPNPADFTIQMHVLLMLAREQPAAGRALCQALQRVADEERVWVYYAKAPLVPMLRVVEAERAGCTLTLPEARTKTSVPGQETWVTVVRLLTQPSPSSAEVREVLGALARNDFALLRSDPPLLYHNDLSATVSRYYWSEDAGYALWLRLAHEHARIGR